MRSSTPSAGSANHEHARVGSRSFSVYCHVPFCAVRCGYCDFTTYTNAELGPGASRATYADTAIQEIHQAQRVTGERSVSTVFFGGGTPTLLPVTDLARMLNAINSTWPLEPNAEVTTEANPDSVTQQDLHHLADAGFTRISLGMQSAVPHVLTTLDRTHNPARLPDVVSHAQRAGLQVSVDLIYGTPGESLEDWRTSVEAALNLGVDHISAYALTVEPHTPMGRRIARGLIAAPNEDDQAAKYELADDLFTQVGLTWYEISNWARGGISGPHACRHNLAYWRNQDWWGIGPGAHSHLDNERFWNVKHPRPYAEALRHGRLPMDGRETLTAEDRELEAVMLGIRLSCGLPIVELSAAAQRAIPTLIAQELIDPRAAIKDQRLILTRQGRLLADTVTRTLVG
ncbi:MAG: radical SAM family heme chaperone HemW [Cellulomonadaceae bacterium]|nr:radical SAM family heme chaperone HemW [Cellulomonadaceae bacterium]